MDGATGPIDGHFDVQGGGFLIRVQRLDPPRTIADVQAIPVQSAQELHQRGQARDIAEVARDARAEGSYVVGLCAYREDTVATAWLSNDEDRTWQVQMDPAELPWPLHAAEPITQWPPGGESVVRVLDRDTAVVITDTGLAPACRRLPPGHVLTPATAWSRPGALLPPTPDLTPGASLAF